MAEKTLNLIGTAGEHYVCAELCRKGYVAVLAPKNNPLYDIVVTTVQGTKSVAIQVKTRANKQGWKLGKDMELERNNERLFVILVNIAKANEQEFYVYRHDEFSSRLKAVYRKYINRPKRDGTARKPVEFRWFDTSNFTNDDFAKKDGWKEIEALLK